MPRTVITIIALLGLSFLVSFGIAVATDAPHNDPESVYCNSCHTLHNSLGPSLTTYATNENLCMSCHKVGGQAANWPFSSLDQAVPGTSGMSHRWDRDMTASAAPLNLTASNPNNAYGLRTAAELANPAVKTMMTKFSNTATCSVCHQQHNQQKTPFDPLAYNASAGDTGTATGGSTTTVIDSSKAWGANAWVNYYVVMSGGTAANIGQARLISSNTNTQLTVSAAFPAPVAATDTYYVTRNWTDASAAGWGTATGGTATTVADGSKTWTNGAWAGYYVKMTGGPNNGLRRRITGNTATELTTDAFPAANAAGNTYYITSGRHFMRANNVLNDLCVDCHYYRATSTSTDVRTYDGNKKSHPVGKRLSDVGDPNQFNASFLEPRAAGWAAQGGTRGELNGGTDTNLTNNITVGIDSKINCLSCHHMHYADSDSSTIDKPTGYAP